MPPPTHTPGWLYATAAGLIVAVTALALVLRPRDPSAAKKAGDDSDDDSAASAYLIDRPEGPALMGDVLDLLTERVRARRSRHAQEAKRQEDALARDMDARRQQANQAEQAIAHELRRLSAADAAPLRDLANKLRDGPILTASERSLAQKHPALFATLLKLTKNGEEPLIRGERAYVAQRAALLDKLSRDGQRVEAQWEQFEQLAETVERDFDAAFQQADKLLAAHANFGEVLTLRGTISCLVLGDYGKALVDC